MSWIALIVVAVVADALGWFPLMYSAIGLAAMFAFAFILYEIIGLD